MEIQELKSIAIELMTALRANGMGEVELETGGAKIKVKSQMQPPCPVPPSPFVGNNTAPAPKPVSENNNISVDSPLPAGMEIKSPLVGTFYVSPAPDAPPFVLVGQKVQTGDTLFIIEAMKTMNEVKAPCNGTVVCVLAQAGDIVEYNQTVMVIQEDK